jgi:hypothetical protein
MKLCVLAGAVALLCAASAPDAYGNTVRLRRVAPANDGVAVDFVNNNAIRYTVTRPALTEVAEVPDASFVGDDFFVAARGARHGCILATPWLPVLLTSGRVLLYPHFRVEWANGVLPASAPKKTLFTFRTAVKHENEQVSQVEKDVDTGFLSLTPTYRVDVYHGVFDGIEARSDRPPIGEVPIKSGDSVQVLVCGVRPLVEITLHDIVLEETP